MAVVLNPVLPAAAIVRGLVLCQLRRRREWQSLISMDHQYRASGVDIAIIDEPSLAQRDPAAAAPPSPDVLLKYEL